MPVGSLAIRSRLILLIVVAVLLEAIFGYVLRSSAAWPLPRLLVWLSAAGIVYLIGVVLVVRHPSGSPVSRGFLGFIFLAALVFRLTLLPLTPSVSHQLWRLHWDGEIQHAGFNPYVYAPNNALFNPIRAAGEAAVMPAPERAATHPPLAEWIAHWDFNWFPGLRAGKIFFVVADLLLILLLMRVLRKRGQPPEWALVYAWSPLAVYEVAGNGCLEPMAALLALGALYLCGRRARWAGALIASAASTLWYAVVLVPIVLAGAGKRWGRALRWGVALAVLFTVPYWFASRRFVLPDLARNLRAEAAAPPFNASLYGLVWAWFGAHAAAAMACVVVVLTLVRVGRQRVAPLRAAFVVLGALLLVMPQVQPRFVLWLLPLLAFFPEAAWLYFSVAVFWAYLVGHSALGTAVEYVPLYALLAWQAWRGRHWRAAQAARL